MIQFFHLLRRVVLVAGLGFAVTAAAEETTTTKPAAKPAAKPTAKPTDLPLHELRVFADVFATIKREYVDQTDAATLLQYAINGMLAGLDPHSAYLSADDWRDSQLDSQGKFGGVGLQLTADDGAIVVIAPLDDTPAAKAGIRPGDVIIRVDGVGVTEMNLWDASNRMRGAPGERVVLTISRDGKMLDVELVRAIIASASVKSELLARDFGYLRIAKFDANTAAETRAQLAQLRQQNDAELRGLVLDLRNNPGGTLPSAIAVSDVFLASGEIVATRGRRAAANQTAQATASGAVVELPMVALVNSGSASAAEIVAGALQDHRRAVIMGTRTFGKGSVQSLLPMHRGGALKLTTARYYTPRNRSIQARGIAPDIVVRLTDESVDAAADGDWEFYESDLFGHLQNADADAPAAAKTKLAAGDNQIAEALKLLKGMTVVQARLTPSTEK